MAGGYRIHNQKELHFVTFQVVDWIDLFTRQLYRDEIISNFRFYPDTQGLNIHAYVIMSNHLHAILSATQPKNDLSSIIGRFKSYTSKRLVELITEGPESRKGWMLNLFAHHAESQKRSKNFQVWTHDNHPIELDTPEKFRQRLDYIHNNPVKAGIIDKPEDYLYSSARNYADLPFLFKVDLVDELLANLRPGKYD